MELSINTPALLFPAITLLMLAYTNRFLALANLVRKLHDEYAREQNKKVIIMQIQNLRSRLNMIRYMQGLGVISFLLCVLCMYLIFIASPVKAHFVFAVSLLSLIASLIISLVEIQQSTIALRHELSDIEELADTNIISDLLPFGKDKHP